MQKPVTTTSTSCNLTTTSSMTAQSGFVYAKLCTSQGAFEVELFQNETPAAVNNFVALANQGFYNNLVWHRIAPNFVIQTGDPNTRNDGGTPCGNWGTGDSNTNVPFEYVPSLHNYAGYLAYASTAAKGSASSQFFVNLKNNTSLDGSYTVFGRVISGMSVVFALGNLPTNPSCTTAEGGPPANPSQAMLISVTILNSP
jgi:cyclophilin family peptidyl-prolyl cis-trans isomerase